MARVIDVIVFAVISVQCQNSKLGKALMGVFSSLRTEAFPPSAANSEVRG